MDSEASTYEHELKILNIKKIPVVGGLSDINEGKHDDIQKWLKKVCVLKILI